MNNITSYLKQGIAKGIVKLNSDESVITYVHQNITRNYTKPEEKVQAETFCKLVLHYKYPESHIRQYVSVTVGFDTKQADIIVYNDQHHQAPHVIVECKKADISEQEFTQAISQVFAYAHATGGTLKYVWVTSGIKNIYHVFDKEVNTPGEPASDIPQYGVKKLSAYKYAYNGGTTQGGQQLSPLEKVSEADLTNIFKQAHQALWGGGELNPSEAFDELDKLIFCKIYDEGIHREEGEAYDFQVITVEPKDKSPAAKAKADEETSSQLLKRIQALYQEGRKLGERKNAPEIFKDDIKLNASKARTVVGYLQGIDLLNTDLDSKGRAFETFMGSFFRGDFGQYFTPRKIVSFIVDSLPITNKSKVLDTSCGSGGFLLHALFKVREQATAMYPDYKNDVRQSNRWRQYWHSFAEHNLYGIEINEQIARTAKMNMIIHDDGHTNVVSADGLIPPADLRKRTENSGFMEGSFDYIITNPPFGSTIKQTEKAYMHQYSLATRDVDWLNPASKAAARPSQSSEVLFIEQAEQYLTDGGYLAIVVPDGILTNSSMQYVRDYISQTYRIVAVVSLPQIAFMANGAGVKSSVMFLKKYDMHDKSRRKIAKEKLQTSLIQDSQEGENFTQLLEDKKEELAKYAKLIRAAEKDNSENIDKLKQERQQISDDFDEKIEKAREILSEKYDENYKSEFRDYPIFMAIAEEIGYDATGRETGKNELDDISKELARFIDAIEKGNDYFFL